MAGLHLEIVTAERAILSEDDIEQVVAPAVDGVIAIRPHHASLITLLQAGELRIRRRSGDVSFAISGGFLEVHQSRVKILADSAERSEDIDLARVQAAEDRARKTLAERKGNPEEFHSAMLALRRSQVRLRVARRQRVSSPNR